MLPFIAVIIILLILFTALQFSLSVAYLSRARIRDALDAAVLSGVSMAYKASSPTRYGERRSCTNVYDGEGNIVGRNCTWHKTTGSRQDYITINEHDAKQMAEQYLHKNLRISNLKDYRVLSLDIQIVKDPHKKQITYRRPNTEGINTTYQEAFPRWIEMKSTATVEVPAPLGGVFGKDRVVVKVSSDARKTLINLPEGVWN